jgi:hypothetical protein
LAPDEPRALFRAHDVKHAGKHHRLVCDDADGASLDAAEASNDIGCVVGLKLEEVPFVRDLPDQLVHVVRRRCAGRDQSIEALLDALHRIFGRPLGNVVAVRQR